MEFNYITTAGASKTSLLLLTEFRKAQLNSLEANELVRHYTLSNTIEILLTIIIMTIAHGSYCHKHHIQDASHE